MKYVMGFGLERVKWVFLDLDKFFIESNITSVYITKELIYKWQATRLNDKRKTLYDKYCVLRQFCRYLCHLGQDCFVPRLPPKVSSEFTPYIFTHEQIKSIFEAADQLTMTNRNMHCTLFAIPALFRFLYSSGVRISEALSVRNEDVDFERKRIILKKTKNQMQRLIPLNTSMIAVLQQYEEHRNNMPLAEVSAPDSFFFISPLGKPLVACTVLVWFKKVLKKCGIPYLGNKKGPRIHDVRHTAATHSLIKMVGTGMDIYCALPILSVFLGHKTIKGTEQYVRLTQEMYPEILKMEQSVTAFVFPKTNPKIEIDYGNY